MIRFPRGRELKHLAQLVVEVGQMFPVRVGIEI